jgi:hypothetical protein
VAGFITEVQAFQQLATGSTSQHGSGLSGGPGSHGGHDSGKPPQVNWARFETIDLNDRSLYPESMEINGKFVQLELSKDDKHPGYFATNFPSTSAINNVTYC